MPDFNAPGVSQQQIAEIVAAAVAPYALSSAVPQFVGLPTQTVEALHISNPPDASSRGKYARVSNYGGSIDKVLRCDFDSLSGIYFWGPAGAPQSFQTVAMTANMTADPLISGDVLNLTGTIGLGVTRTVTLSTLRGRPGDIKTVRNGLSTLLGGLNILGTGLGSGIASLLGATSTYGCQWNSTTSQLEWTRLT